MAKRTAPLLPSTDEVLHRFGERLRLARQRRRLTAKQVAERAGMSPMTLRSLERGSAGVTMGAYLLVMQVLGIEKDLDLLGQEDPVGRQLQDARLPARVRTSTSVSSVGNKSHDVGDSMSTEQLSRVLRSLLGEQLCEALISIPRDQRREHAAPRGTSNQRAMKDSKRAGREEDWVEKGGFASADTLARLIKAPPVRRPRKAR